VAVDVFSTAPQSAEHPANSYPDHLLEVARWSEHSGCRGILIYADNRLVDGWLLAQEILKATARLAPLVAVQPAYMHPYTVAKMVATLGLLHGRQVFLNMVAGGFRQDLIALGDNSDHELRYARLMEYTTIIQRLLEGNGPVTIEGRFYQVRNLNLAPVLGPVLQPGIMLSGSSEAGKDAARTLGALAVEYPDRDYEFFERTKRQNAGVRLGIIAAETDDRAWTLAEQRFPGDKQGRLMHKLAMKTSDSVWHQKLTALEESGNADERDPYWLWPFKNYNTFCPYLVGSFNTVSTELAKYLTAGFTTFILDIPKEEADLTNAMEAITLARRKAQP
jgi:alkanesulfonate monooxygenase